MNKISKVAILCVNYNSYKELDDYINSICVAAIQVANAQIDIIVADNSTKKQDIVCQTPKNVSITIHPTNENLGYLGGIFCSLDILSQSGNLDYDLFVFSNVDLKLKNNFFAELLKICTENIAWIAPKIAPTTAGNMLYRPTKLKLNFLIMFYRSPVFYLIHHLLYRYRRHKKKKKIFHSLQKMNIYAGHGSIMIFTKSFILKNFPFHFPAFLYGEEIYFAELARLSNMRVVYTPTVEVINIGNVSTKLLGNKKRCKMSYDALMELKKMYFQ